MKSNPPSKDIKICLVTLVTLFEQPPQAQIRPKSKYFCSHKIANDRTIILSTENVQKVHSRLNLWGFEKGQGKIGENAMMVILFKRLPQAQIGPKFKNYFAHQIANDKTIIEIPGKQQKIQYKRKRAKVRV